jgi:hypothetical protein
MSCCEYEFIFACKWFETKRNHKPHTTLYYKYAKDTEWVFGTCDYLEGKAKVEYIKVCKSSGAFDSAVHNSLPIEEKQKMNIKNQVIQELHNHLYQS